MPSINRILLPLSAAVALVLPSCISFSPREALAPLAGYLPLGYLRDQYGILTIDPSAPPTAQEAAYVKQAGRPKDVISYWSGEPGDGPARILISLSEQTSYFYKGNQLVGKSWLSTGDEGHRTPAGSFRIIQKNKWHESSRYGVFVDASGNVVDGDVDVKKDRPPPGCRYEGAKMTNFMRLTSDGVGMHAGFLPGYPASHGCIRMQEHMSEHFFNNVEEGTPVTIVP